MKEDDFTMVYDKILDSTIAANYEVRHFFEDILKLVDWSTGHVNMTPDAIHRRLNMPIEKVEEGLKALMEPDLQSNRKDEGGRRIVLIDLERQWGWRVVNYLYYKGLRSKAQRRGYMKDYMAEYRAEAKADSNGGATPDVKTSKPPKVTHDQTNYPPEVQQIYDLYPRHEAKPAALRAIAKALQTTEPVFLAERVGMYADARAGQDMKYTPLPASWFNDERFNDDPSLWEQSNGTKAEPIQNQI